MHCSCDTQACSLVLSSVIRTSRLDARATREPPLTGLVFSAPSIRVRGAVSTLRIGIDPGNLEVFVERLD